MSRIKALGVHLLGDKKDLARTDRVMHAFNLCLATVAELTPDPQEAMEVLARASAWGISEVGENADNFIDFMLKNLDVLKAAKKEEAEKTVTQ